MNVLQIQKYGKVKPLIKNIQTLCQEHGITVPRLEVLLALPRGTIIKWNDASPSIDLVKMVAEYFDVSIDYLVGSKEKGFLSEKKKKWLKSVGAVDISEYSYLIPSCNHLFNEYYLEFTDIEKIKKDFNDQFSTRKLDDLPDVLEVKDIAPLLQLSEARVGEILKLTPEYGGLKHMQIGRRLLVYKSDLIDWLEKLRGGMVVARGKCR